MNDNQSFTAAATSSVTKEFLRSLIDQMTLARAAELARAGHYAAAEEVLSIDKDNTTYDVATLDLLARIHAQQGRLAEAEKLWTRASVLDPANSAYVLALRRTASLRNGSRRAVMMLSFICIIACALIGFWQWRHSAKTGSAGAPSTDNPRDQSSANLPSLESRADTSIENRINVSGVTVMRQPNGLTLSFDDGLFQRGLILKPGARRKLTELGRQLKSYSGNNRFQIIGMTDDLPMPRHARYPDNVSLGMDRARFVYDYLRFICGLDSRHFAIGSSGSEGQTPDRNSDQTINRARSRTVVLHIGAR